MNNRRPKGANSEVELEDDFSCDPSVTEFSGVECRIASRRRMDAMELLVERNGGGVETLRSRGRADARWAEPEATYFTRTRGWCEDEERKREKYIHNAH